LYSLGLGREATTDNHEPRDVDDAAERGRVWAMESATFRKWLADRGCTFERHERGKGGLGHASVTVRLKNGRAELPDIGTKKHLHDDVVRKIVADLGLNYDELPGPKSRV